MKFARICKFLARGVSLFACLTLLLEDLLTLARTVGWWSCSGKGSKAFQTL